jgi:hypothetical protein
LASNLDSLLNGTTVSVSGSSISLASLTEAERGILLVALLALEQANNRAPTGSRAIGGRVGRSTGAIESVLITPGSG